MKLNKAAQDQITVNMKRVMTLMMMMMRVKRRAQLMLTIMKGVMSPMKINQT